MAHPGLKRALVVGGGDGGSARQLLKHPGIEQVLIVELDEKDLPFQEAAFGIASLECAVAAVLNEWARRGKPCPLERILNLFTSGPASILPEKWKKLGKIEEGRPADLTVIDLDQERVVRVDEWESKARLTPWDGKHLQGWPVMTLVEGRIVHSFAGSI